MKKILSSAILGLILLGSTVAVYGQDENDSKEKTKVKGGTDEVIIKKKGDKNGKVTIEFKDDEVLVNGKPLSEFEDDNISVSKNRISVWDGYSRALITPRSPFRVQGLNGENYILAGDHAFLGVTTEKGEKGSKGVKITRVTENSPAEKAGLKKGDVILKLDDAQVESFSELSKLISKHKADDKVTITYLRGNKEEKTTATLTNHSMSFSYMMPKINAAPEMPDFNFDGNSFGETYSYSFGRPHFGIKAQDTEDGKGVKVLEVSDESAAAKAGLKEDDIITEFDGKPVNSADELANLARESKEKPSVTVKYLRDGKSESAELKIPRKLKTANL